MKIINKFTAIKICDSEIDEVLIPKLEYGRIGGAYYSREIPKTEFDTEEEAYAHAYKLNKWATWLILPIIRFEI